ncbi:hypothetical protein HYX06_06015 [Candidatus Woesearchaeota archaeon]|nr:hypothetical protein [Candidatus Woesearchaeota archaeon]
MIKKARELIEKLELGFIELFIGFFMLIGLVGYFGSLPADWDWIDHTVAFIMFTYFFYILDITSIIFGKKSKIANLIIPISYLSIFFKDIIAYTGAGAFNFTFLKFINPVYIFLAENLFLVTSISIYLGLLGLAISAAYISRNIEISHPSLLYAVYKKPLERKIPKFLISFLLLLAFYYLIYNPILEWLEFVLDDPIIVVGTVYYITKIARHHKKFHESHAISKIGDIVWTWYGKFISLFHYRKTLPLAISGLLILHGISDIGVFAYSLIFGGKSLYLDFLDSGHATFFRLFINDAANSSPATSIFLSAAYFFNALSLLILFLIPIIVWIRMFSQKGLHLNRIYLFFIYASVLMYISLPGYSISRISSSDVIGADINSRSILGIQSVLRLYFPERETLVAFAVLLSLALGLIVYLLSLNHRVKKEAYALAIVLGLAFYAAYFYNFFISLIGYLFDTISAMTNSGNLILAALFMIFAVFSILFYIGGYLVFLYEIIMEYHRRKWSEPIDEELVYAIGSLRRIKRRMIRK